MPYLSLSGIPPFPFVLLESQDIPRGVDQVTAQKKSEEEPGPVVDAEVMAEDASQGVADAWLSRSVASSSGKRGVLFGRVVSMGAALRAGGIPKGMSGALVGSVGIPRWIV